MTETKWKIQPEAPVIDASFAMAAIRSCKTDADVLKLAPSLTPEQIAALRKGHARLYGNSRDGLTFGYLREGRDAVLAAEKGKR